MNLSYANGVIKNNGQEVATYSDGVLSFKIDDLEMALSIVERVIDDSTHGRSDQGADNCRDKASA